MLINTLPISWLGYSLTPNPPFLPKNNHMSSNMSFIFTYKILPTN